MFSRIFRTRVEGVVGLLAEGGFAVERALIAERGVAAGAVIEGPDVVEDLGEDITGAGSEVFQRAVGHARKGSLTGSGRSPGERNISRARLPFDIKLPARATIVSIQPPARSLHPRTTASPLDPSPALRLDTSHQIRRWERRKTYPFLPPPATSPIKFLDEDINRNYLHSGPINGSVSQSFFYPGGSPTGCRC